MSTPRTHYTGAKSPEKEYRGVRRLLSAVVLGAFEELEMVIEKGGLSGSRIVWLRSDSAYAWIMADRRECMLDYEEICLVLGLDAQAGRRHAEEINEKTRGLLTGVNAPDQGQRHDGN